MDVPLKPRFAAFLASIRPTDAQRKQARAELEFLEGKLSTFISDDDPFEFVKALRSGGFPKATSLKRSESADFDADLAVYVKTASGADTAIDELLDYLEQLAKRAYNKRTTRKPTFDRSQESCVRIIFDVTPKLNIDLVPIVAIENSAIPNWGVIPRRDGEKRHTSVTEHIEFVRSRNKEGAAVPFHQLIRLFKRWRKHAFSEDEQQKITTFVLELVLAKAYDEQEHRLAGEALEDLMILTRWIVQQGLGKEISFPDPRVPSATVAHPGPVIVLDPVNRDNNVTHSWSTSDCDVFVAKVDEFLDVLRDASLEVPDDVEAASEFLEVVLPGFTELSQE